MDLDAALLRGLGEHGDEAGPAADGFDGQPAPKFEFAVDLERLAAVDRNEANAFLAHPVQRIEALGNQKLDQIGIGAILRNARHVVEELVGGIGAEIRGLDFRRREVGHQRLDVVDAVIDDADRARGEAAVAAGFVLGRRFAHDDLGALLLRRQRRAERRIAGADNDHISNSFAIPVLLIYSAACGDAAVRLRPRRRIVHEFFDFLELGFVEFAAFLGDLQHVPPGGKRMQRDAEIAEDLFALGKDVVEEEYEDSARPRRRRRAAPCRN